MYEFMQNAFFLFTGALCLAGAGVIVAVVSTIVYKLVKRNGGQDETRKN
jgi:hypothetical protein